MQRLLQLTHDYYYKAVRDHLFSALYAEKRWKMVLNWSQSGLIKHELDQRIPALVVQESLTF